MVIPYVELQRLAETYNLSHIIMLAHSPEPYQDHIVTYGQSIKEADQAAEFGNTLKSALGWPDSLHAQSAKATARIAELEEALDDLIAHCDVIDAFDESPAADTLEIARDILKEK
jgi:hypothetical protein